MHNAKTATNCLLSRARHFNQGAIFLKEKRTSERLQQGSNQGVQKGEISGRGGEVGQAPGRKKDSRIVCTGMGWNKGM